MRFLKKAAAIAAVSVLFILSFIFSFKSDKEQSANHDMTAVYIVDSYGEKIFISDMTGKIEYAERMSEKSVRYEQQPEQVLPYRHTLVVPKGEDFSLTLSDGTTVMINSGSSITYPSHFSDTSERIVMLNYGEAFFNVAHDVTHPFIVRTSLSETKVLGTRFNVQKYTNESCYITLAEGSVAVKRPSETWDNSLTLAPSDNSTGKSNFLPDFCSSVTASV